MTRDDFRKLIAGHFALMNGIERDSLNKYVEGGLFAFDFFQKNRGKHEGFNKQSDAQNEHQAKLEPIYKHIQQKGEVIGS